jgi:PAS domain S-box-containing protein
MTTKTLGSGLGARRVIVYAAILLGCLAAAPWIHGLDWVGTVYIHTLHELVAVLLALGVSAIALLRFYSRKSDTFLLLGAAFAGTAFLDGMHAVQAAIALPVSPSWSWFAARLFLSVFLWWSAPAGRDSTWETRLDERRVYLLVGGVALACLAFFNFVPLPPMAFPGLALHRPAELLPALFFLLAFVRHLRWGRWRDWRFEHWLMLALLLGTIGETVFMPFVARPFDALSEAGHMAKNLSYLCVLVGLLGSMYSLFQQADEGAAELARINAKLQAEIDERTHAEAERDRFFDISQEMLSIAGLDGHFRQLNPAWEKVLGWTVEELRSRPSYEFIHPDDWAATKAAGQRLRQDGSMSVENRYRTRSGEYRWLSWRAVASPDRGLVYAVARDVEEEKRIAHMKNDFVSVVSHELRTPLTSIRGSLGLIAGGVAGELPEKARALVEIAAKNCERLVRLINDILDVEKIESGQMGFHFMPVELAPLIERSIEDNRAYAEGYGVELQTAAAVPGAWVWADPDRLLQVMTNLISNAVKFSPRGSVVEIATARGLGDVRLSVTDHGRGISPELRPRLFERFAQADSSSTREKGGTGLGLSISRAIIERHRGRIGFTSEPGVTTTFFCDLPEWGTAIEEAPPEDARERPLLLVCEDDRDVAQLLCLMLEREGYRAHMAHDAATARRMLRERAYAALTLDLVLPDQDGVTLIRELRRDEATSRLPIVVVSVRAQEGQAKLNGGALGVIDWLEKPIDERRLLAAVERAVKAPRGREAVILHVEDDLDLQRVVAAIVDGDARIEPALNLAEARERLAGGRFDLVILDLALPDGSGLELLPELGVLDPPTPVLIFSAHEVDQAVAGRVAAVLVKTQTSNRELLERIRSALRGPAREAGSLP